MREHRDLRFADTYTVRYHNVARFKSLGRKSAGNHESPSVGQQGMVCGNVSRFGLSIVAAASSLEHLLGVCSGRQCKYALGRRSTWLGWC